METSASLQARRSTINGDAKIAGLFFQSVLAVLSKELGAEAAEQVQRERLPKLRPLALLRYPVAHFLHLVDGVAMALEKTGVSYPDGLARAGRSVGDIFFETSMGKTVLIVTQGRPQMLLSRAPWAYLTVMSFGERVHSKLGEREGQVSFHGELLGPDVSRGIIKGGMERGATLPMETRIESLKTDTEFVIACKW